MSFSQPAGNILQMFMQIGFYVLFIFRDARYDDKDGSETTEK